MTLTPDETRRYNRHLILPEIGMAGQTKLKESSLLLIGAGGLGSPVALYLAARTSRGLVTRPRNNSFDLATLFLAYTGAQGAAAALVVRLFPGTV